MTDLQTSAANAPADIARGPAPQEAIQHGATGADRARSVVKHILLIIASLIMIYPLLWMLVSSLRPTDVIFRTPGLWLNDVYIKNYTEGWF